VNKTLVIDLPQYILSNEGLINYLYAADGRKLGKRVYTERVNLVLDERYIGNLVIENDMPRRILHPDGSIEFDVNGYDSLPDFRYNLTDHLGNVRVVLTPSVQNDPVTLQTNDYYPFGMVFPNSPEQINIFTTAKNHNWK
jgi:hypothetical protein